MENFYVEEETRVYMIIRTELENSMADNLEIQATRQRQKCVLKRLRIICIFKIVFQLMELILFSILYNMESLSYVNFRRYFLLPVVMNILKIHDTSYLLGIIKDYLKLLQKSLILERQPPFPKNAFTNTTYLFDAIMSRDRYGILLLEQKSFEVGYCMLIKYIYEKCEYGNLQLNFIFAVALAYLIVKHLIIEIHTLYLVIKIPYAFYIEVYNFYQLVTHEYLNKLKVEIVGIDKINKDLECAICQSEFFEGEEFIRLNCHKFHLFHKKCIFVWLKVKSACPLCGISVGYI